MHGGPIELMRRLYNSCRDDHTPLGPSAPAQEQQAGQEQHEGAGLGDSDAELADIVPGDVSRDPDALEVGRQR
jgi:hypothetical protein